MSIALRRSSMRQESSMRQKLSMKQTGEAARFFAFFCFACFLFSCQHWTSRLQSPPLSFKGAQVFKKHKSFKGLRIGGLSEIVFDPDSGDFFALSDDKKNHRFYRLKLNCQARCQFQVQDQVLLRSTGQKNLGRSMDPEAIVLSDKSLVFIASEGRQMKAWPFEPSQIFTFTKDGTLLEAWPLPQLFWDLEKSFGPKANKGFESLTLDHGSGLVWTGTEQPLRQDSTDLKTQKPSFIRLSAFRIEDKSLSAQYGYPLSGEGYGLTALEFLQDKVFISLERAYKRDKKQGVNSVRLFLADCRGADDIKAYLSLSQAEVQFHVVPTAAKPDQVLGMSTQKQWHYPCQKQLLWDSSKQPSIPVDNMEGMVLARGVFPSGDPLLVLLSDNNFNEEKQKTIFLFFTLKIDELGV